ncbi:Galactose oxidase/kelch repeat superfamily protein isoform 1 [Tripterygium wilfordii]|uniref:Galactose oxidase/kelch repeat superfamily protein isoform 1 n=1 Tax=Tripterygium wilfordii TaxID=458696 RepID=A0A7J7D4I9_TRIWF|nr:F-box/kelch-repeat protein At3g24760 [Tripterygium wilfordii]KAF5741252.1 Galactose oxidase/kelch repeat superfamily protein isoform 1 [Tripterygium wilfordii]
MSSEYSAFTTLSDELTEHILSLLPIPSLLRASAVCNHWRSLISSPLFPHRNHLPWFFLLGLHNTSSKNHQSFAFDPISHSWFRLPAPTLLTSSYPPSASHGFLFTTADQFSFSPVINPRWTSTSPLRFPRINPLFAALPDSSADRFLVVGGVRFIGGLVDIEDHPLATEIYNSSLNSWELCPPLPEDFVSQSLSSALFGNRFYVFEIHSCFMSYFDLDNRVWSQIQMLRPPGVIFSFLIACKGMLVLAGMCNSPTSLNLWKIEESTMELSEIAIMPLDLLYGLIDSEEDDKFACLKCVGMGNLIYVFNDEYHKKFPACVCEIDSVKGSCSWRRLPQLPLPVNKFHKVISFSSTVSGADFLRR